MYVYIYIYIFLCKIETYIDIDTDIFRLKQRKNPVLRERSRRFPTVILNTAWNGCDGSYTISFLQFPGTVPNGRRRFRTISVF